MVQNNKNKRQKLILYLIIGLVAAFIARSLLMPTLGDTRVEQVSYSEFLQKVERGEVKKVQLDTGTKSMRFTTSDGAGEKAYETTQFPNDSSLVCLLYTSPSPRDISGSRMPSSA